MKKHIITIDGGVATGTTTLSKDIALALGIPRIDSGSIYRAFTYEVLRHKVDPNNAEACTKIARDAKVDMPDGEAVAVNGITVVEWIDGQRIDNLHTKPVDDAIPAVATHKHVRSTCNDKQREFAKERGAVVDGRDTGTVVFPNADLKIFLVVDEVVAAKRRSFADGREVTPQEILDRNEADRHHKFGALAKADDAVEIDTSHISIAEMNQIIMELLNTPAKDRARFIRRQNPDANIERIFA